MFTGVDIGGTNTDVVVIGEEITAKKVPNSVAIEKILRDVSSDTRLAISTSELLNRFLTKTKPEVCTITIPGPGLFQAGSVHGAVGHRGEVLDPLNPDEVAAYIREHKADALAIIGKFSVRNPCLEEELEEIARKYYQDSNIAVSHVLGYLNMPARITATTINAALKKEISRITGQIKKSHQHFYFVSGDAGLVHPDRTYRNPVTLYHSSPATAALGSYYLSHQKNGLVVDIGGTTTDIIPLRDGKPVVRPLVIHTKKAGCNAVHCESVPFGGDSLIEKNLLPWREGYAQAYGGEKPTLTDAINRTGIADIGIRTSAGLSKEQAEQALETYFHSVDTVIHTLDPGPLIGAGFLAPYLLPEIASRSHRQYIIPEYASCANAVGAAVSRVSISLYVHADTGQGIVLYNGVQHPIRKNTDDDTLIFMATEEVQRQAQQEGAPPSDVREVFSERFFAYDIVKGWNVDARIVDFIVRIAPGITGEAL